MTYAIHIGPTLIRAGVSAHKAVVIADAICYGRTRSITDRLGELMPGQALELPIQGGERGKPSPLLTITRN